MWTERGPIQEPTTSQPEESIMATTESLRLSLDNTNAKIQRLEAKNQKLHDDHLERAAEADLSSEVQRLRELYEQALKDI